MEANTGQLSIIAENWMQEGTPTFEEIKDSLPII